MFVDKPSAVALASHRSQSILRSKVVPDDYPPTTRLRMFPVDPIPAWYKTTCWIPRELTGLIASEIRVMLLGIGSFPLERPLLASSQVPNGHASAQVHDV